MTNRNAGVRAAIVAAFIVLIMGGQQLVVWQVNRETLANRAIGVDMDQRLKGIEGRTLNRWTADEHHRWVKELQRLNPGLVLPPDDVMETKP